MFTPLKKMFLTSLIMLVLTMSGTWHGTQIVRAENQNADVPEAPLYPGLTWNDLGLTNQAIRLSAKESISLPGQRYEATEQFITGLPQDVLDYYSNGQLATGGWESYDAYNRSGGLSRVYAHASGVYLIVEFGNCPGGSISTCVAVWISAPVEAASITPDKTSEPGILATGSFGKTAPTNGATGINPANTVLSWGAYSPTPDKYSYCIQEGSACAASDPDWTSSFERSVTLTNLAYDKIYYWQVKAITCVTCVPKTVVYADNGTVWTFKTKAPTHVVIVGNAGVAGAVLSYTDGSAKTVTADNYGSYLITVPVNWSGTITPSKSGYLFSPKHASFTNLTASQTIQNFTAIVAYTISGNVGVSGVTMSYTDGTPQTVTSGANGNYSIVIPANWSGTVTPSKTGFTFTPASKDYTNVTSNKTSENYTALVEISGNAGVAGATLSYTDGALKTVNADGGGLYSIKVPLGWTGTVTPSHTGYTFVPVNRSYNNLQSGQSAQNYTAVDAPVVLSSVRADANPTSGPSVNFTVTFSESVSGVDAGDFALTTTGLTGASVTNVSGSNAVYTVTVSTGSGSGTLRLDVVDNDSITDGSNPLGGAGSGNGNFTSGQVYEVNKVTILSLSSADGWVLESAETSTLGGTMNKNATALKLGDDAGNKQFRSILSFDTSVIPDNATITSVTLRFKEAGVSGTNPFNTHGALVVDIRLTPFSDNINLQLSDFNAPASTPKALIYTNTKVDNWYSQTLIADHFDLINLTGVTQFRLRFAKDDNNDLGADFLKLFSGNAAEANRPQLIIEYSVP